MSLLTIVQQFCKRTNLPSPSSVIGSTDEQILQALTLLEETGQDLVRRGAWEGTTFEGTLTTIATIDQGAISSIAANGYNYLIPNSLWDRTNQWPVLGPLTKEEWQARLAWTVTGPRSEFMIRGGKLLVYPAPTAGWSWAFHYVSKNWLTNAAGTTYHETFQADDDEVLLPETTLLLGLRWRWKAEKGLDYAQLFQEYEQQIRDAIGRDASKATLHMDEDIQPMRTPGVFVPSGTWNL